MKKERKSKKGLLDLAEKEVVEPLRYHSNEDLSFSTAAINYFKWYFLDNNSDAESNITDWWRQKTICVRSKNVKNEDEEGWTPDLLQGKCCIVTYFINDETEEKWQERKRGLHHLYSPAIAAYHESVFANTIKRISPGFKNIIMKHYLENKNKEEKK